MIDLFRQMDVDLMERLRLQVEARKRALPGCGRLTPPERRLPFRFARLDSRFHVRAFFALARLTCYACTNRWAWPRYATRLQESQ